MSTLLSCTILYFNFQSSKKSFTLDKNNILAIENTIYLVLPVFIILIFLSFLPLSMIIQRVGLFLSYFCLITNILILSIYSPLKLILGKANKNHLKITFFALLSLAIISADIFKGLFRNQYSSRDFQIREEIRQRKNR